MTFPHSAALYLRSNSSTLDKLTIKVITPGGDVGYDIPVMKAQNYTLDEIFEKNLLFLIPFYIFSHESQFKEYEQDAKRLNELKAEYEKIKDKLEDLENAGTIDEYTRCTIIDMSNKVLEHIAAKYNSVKEGVKSVMGGKILDYEAKRIKNQGRDEGRKEGRVEGGLEMLFNLVSDGMLSIEQAAFKAQLAPDIFEQKMLEHLKNGKITV